MKPILLIDFGSTYTKLTAVDVDGRRVLGTSQSYTTVETDINEGFDMALVALFRQTGELRFEKRFACSSAAGGLRMVTSGLVPELTAEAARIASLGAGAKVVKVFSYQLTDEDVDEISRLAPDIFLLTGGTDGGNSATILHNARMLASCPRRFPVLIAGNRVCAKDCETLLCGWETYRCANVLPRLGQLCVEPVQEKIREVFLNKIIFAKGLSKAVELLSGILMPTPSAMFAAMKLLSGGVQGEAGIGDLIAVDLGGATTDVYSMADGLPGDDRTVLKGLQEPYAKRTVEGDLGMRYNAMGIFDAVGALRLSQLSGIAASRVVELVGMVSSHTEVLPDTDELLAFDKALACAAIDTAVTRHAGTIEEVYTPMGRAFVQIGKDLRDVSRLVVTGGAIIHNPQASQIAGHAFAGDTGLFDLSSGPSDRCSSQSEPSPSDLPSPVSQNGTDRFSLKPRRAEVYVDRRYILAAMGLLSTQYPEAALAIMKKELEHHGAC